MKDFRILDALRRRMTVYENDLVDELAAGRIGRREFLRHGSVLGLSLPVLGGIAGTLGLGTTLVSKPAHAAGGTIRVAGLVATGRPGTLQIRLVDPVGQGTREGLGACTGDSGAPVFEYKQGGPVIVGVVSWSTGPNGSAGCGGMTGVTPLTLYRVDFSDGTFVYVPTRGFVGTDTFTYKDTDVANGVSDPATVTINVVNVGGITVAPTAAATTNSLTETFTQSVLAPTPGSFKFGAATAGDKQFVAAAAKIEDTGLAAYNGQTENMSRQTLTAVARVISVEARHAAWARSLAGQVPAPVPADEPISAAQALNAIKPYLA